MIIILMCSRHKPIDLNNFKYKIFFWPPLWSSGQSSWLQNRRLGFDSRHYQNKKSSGSGVSTTKELLNGKVAAPV
jgi:hypothetical protein